MVDASRPAIIGAIHKTVNDINHLLRRQDDDQNKSELLQLLRDCTNIKATILTSLSKMNVSKAKPGHSELTRKNKRLALKAEKSQVNTGVWKGGIEKARLYSKSLPRMTASAKDRAKGMYKACAPTVAQGLMHMLGSQSQIPSATVRKLDIIPVYTPRRSPPQPPPPPKAERSKAWEAKNMQGDHVRVCYSEPNLSNYEERSVVLPEKELCQLFPLIESVLLKKRSSNESFDTSDILCWDEAVCLGPKHGLLPFQTPLKYIKSWTEPKLVFYNSLAQNAYDAQTPLHKASTNYGIGIGSDDGKFCSFQTWLRIMTGDKFAMKHWSWTPPKSSLIESGVLLGVDDRYIKMVDEIEGDYGYRSLFEQSKSQQV